MADLRRLRGLMAAGRKILDDIERNRQTKQETGAVMGKALLGQYAKQAFPSPLEEAQTGLFKAYSKNLLGPDAEGAGTMPDMDVAGINVKGLQLKAPGKLTPIQQQEQMQSKRFFEAWLQGNEIPAQTQTGVATPPPKTQEEAHWGLMQFGEDPAQYDFSHLPTQTQSYGKPAGGGAGAAAGIMRIFPGYTKAGAFKPEISPVNRFTGKAAGPIEDAQITQYAPEEEQMIEDNMAAYKRPREEVIAALKAKGYIK